MNSTFKKRLVGSICVAVLAASASCGGSRAPAASASAAACPSLPNDPAHPHFGYDPNDTVDGPSAWGTIRDGAGAPAYPACATSTQQQAPIAFPATSAPWATGGVKLDGLTLSWSKAAVATAVINNGHTWKALVGPSPANTISVQNETYTMSQFHVHSPSEHTVGGKQYPLEAHFVHGGGKGFAGVAVGVFFEEDTVDNAELAKVWSKFSACPQATEASLPAATTLDLTALLPANASHFEYDGGLTAPPCSQVVHFFIMTTPIKASAGQIKALRDALGPNARPTQPVLNQKSVTYQSQN